MTTKKIATPWGPARLVDEVAVEQDADGRGFSSLVQLLVGPAEERLVRFAYSSDGVARRGPVTFRDDDLARLREALTGHAELAAALDLKEVRPQRRSRGT
jgi:hypothetical protein